MQRLGAIAQHLGAPTERHGLPHAVACRAPADSPPAGSPDPEGKLEFSVVYTDRALNHMSPKFQGVMKDISATLKAQPSSLPVLVRPLTSHARDGPCR